MSVKNLFMMIFMVIVFPIIILCYDANAFFLIMSGILIFLSIGGLNNLVAPAAEAYDEDEMEPEEVEEAFSEIGEVLGINTRRLGYGFIIAMDLMIITYFVYSFFIVNILFLKAIAIILIADWMYDIIGVIDNMINANDNVNFDAGEDDEFTWKDRLYELYLWVHNIGTIGFIVITFFFKYFG
jgi:hypothetical protein